MKEFYRYAIAIALVLLACAVTFVLRPWIAHTPTGFFGLAVLGCSLTLGPALAAALLSVSLNGYLFMEPLYSFRVDSGSDLLRLAFLLVMAITVSSVCESRNQLERVMEAILLFRGIEPQIRMCEHCHHIQRLNGEWMSLPDVVKTSGALVVDATCPACSGAPDVRRAVRMFTDSPQS